MVAQKPRNRLSLLLLEATERYTAAVYLTIVTIARSMFGSGYRTFVSVPNRVDRETFTEISRFFDFRRWRPSAVLDL